MSLAFSLAMLTVVVKNNRWYSKQIKAIKESSKNTEDFTLELIDQVAALDNHKVKEPAKTKEPVKIVERSKTGKFLKRSK
jgi:hydroxyethylthiazole kinase-like sugar kinase family protein